MWAVCLMLVAIGIFVYKWHATSARIPPGPLPLPLIGHLHLLLRGPAPNILFKNLAEKYGPVVSLRLGSVPVVVASTSEAAREFLKTNDVAFASRPATTGHKDLALTPYGDQWRQLRKVCTMELFTARRIASFKQFRMEEVKSLLNLIKASSGSTMDVREKVTGMTLDVICRILMGKRYFGENVDNKEEATEFIRLIDDIFELVGAFPIGEYLPWLRWMDLGHIEARFKAVSKSMDAQILMEHRTNKNTGDANNDFVDLLLELQDNGEACLQDPETIISLLINLFTGGTDTSSVTIEWALAELIKHPASLHKLQNELFEVAGDSRLIEESDIPNLKYLEAVVKETFRLHPAVPLLLPHFSTTPCKVMGYDIAKGTTLHVNIYAVGRDPSVWENPLEFIPERFLNRKIDFRDFELFPFGGGRRICPGMSLALLLVHLTLANLVHGFEWKTPVGLQVDTTNEKFGTTVLMANQLKAIPITRLRQEAFH